MLLGASAEAPASAYVAALTAALLCCVAFYAQVFRTRTSLQKAQLFVGLGTPIHSIMKRVPLLASCPTLGLPSSVQLMLYALQMMWQEWYCESQYEFQKESFHVTLPGNAVDAFPDVVHVKWLQGAKGCKPRELPSDAPVVLLTPGLNCYSANLPGTAVYKTLLERPWRIGVYEKRGLDQRLGLQSPAFHMFGHPSDLHVVVKQITARWPEAPLHLLGMSSGNGLASSYLALHGHEVPNLRSCLLLIGGEDYNSAFSPPKANWLSPIVLDGALLKYSKERMVQKNEAILRAHNANGYEAAMKAKTLQDFYNICMDCFSGYTERQEAESRINAFNGGNNTCLQSFKVPFLVCYTEDDPVAPGGPRPSWLDVISKCDYAASAIFPTGSHLACYDSWTLSRWVDRLAVEWIDAVEWTNLN